MPYLLMVKDYVAHASKNIQAQGHISKIYSNVLLFHLELAHLEKCAQHVEDQHLNVTQSHNNLLLL